MPVCDADSSTPLATPVADLRGVGPERAGQLARLGLCTVADLLHHVPRRYEDRRHMLSIAELQLQQPATVRGTIVALGVKRFAQGRKSVFELILDDGSARLHCRWWNLPYMQNYFRTGEEVLAFGRPNSLRPRTMDHPDTEVIDGGEELSIHLNRIAPVYPLTEGLPQRWIRALLWRTLESFGPEIREPWPLVSEMAGITRAQAFRNIHFPVEPGEAEKARQRLALDEFIELQLAMQIRRRNLEAKARSRPCAGDNRMIKPFLSGLPFALTGAQTRVLREVRQDLKGQGAPMRRLLQGDVGSGKTVVAACCALMVLESGFNVVLMAPTEILAIQHYETFSRWFDALHVPIDIFTGSRKTVEKPLDRADRSVPGPFSRPGPRLAIGTHALIEDSFSMENLGLVIIDEQHKFGVAQRERLVRKGEYPHLLVMTATPIPRTLGLTLYGDLDLSVLDELPGGRKPIQTFVRTRERRPRVMEFVRKHLAGGRQAYVVCPRVEESGASELKAVTKEWEALQKELAPFQAALLHGRMAPEEKEMVMAGFRTGKTQILLSTALIEVGVDVPNATIMIIEDADHFGLAQLHQLRGRIGRGAYDSFCILLTSAKSPEAAERLRIMVETTDGFRIAEEDMRLRGPGDLIGQSQSGLPPLNFGRLAEDLRWIEAARLLARRILDNGNPRSSL